MPQYRDPATLCPPHGCEHAHSRNKTAQASSERSILIEYLAASSALIAGALALAALILFVRRRQDRERG
jgi:hypothetical protein